MSPDAISGLVVRCAKAAGIPFVSLHQFRHSCAADLLEAGATMPEVKAMLGHAVIATTMRYSAVSGDERAKAVAKHPVNDFLRAVAAADERATI